MDTTGTPDTPRLQGEIGVDIEGWDAITAHRTGTAGDAACAEWLVARLAAAGIVGTTVTFPFRRLAVRACRVEADGQQLDGLPLFDGGLTSDSGLQGALRQAGTGAPVRTIALQPFSAYEGHPDTRALQVLRASGQPLAVVAVANADPLEPGLAVLNAEHWPDQFGVPVVQVASQHRLLLDRLAQAGGDVRLVAHGERVDGSAANVEARIPGTDARLAPLVVMTPRSAWWTCTAERGGGIAAWLAIARRFALAPPKRTVVFTANTGHELGHVGLHRFLDQTGALVRAAHCWVHLGANFIARGGRVRIQASTPELLEPLQDVLLQHDPEAPLDVTAPGARPLGEARDIHARGGRFVSILGTNPWFHNPADRWPTSVDPIAATRRVEAMVALAERLASGD